MALYDEAQRLRFGLGKGGPWLRAHLKPDGTHYMAPDPASYYWPDPPRRSWWQCGALLHMIDGARVTSSVAVLRERFDGLPDSVNRREQRRLVHVIRWARYDQYLWGRNHRAECGTTTCGYDAAEVVN